MLLLVEMRVLGALLCVMMCFSIITSAVAQSKVVERTINAKHGHNVRIGVFASIRPDCGVGRLPTIRLKVPPTHGKVMVKQGKLRARNFRQCLAVEVPAYFVIYKPKPDFSGTDVVVLEVISAAGKTQIQKITILLGASAGGRQI